MEHNEEKVFQEKKSANAATQRKLWRISRDAKTRYMVTLAMLIALVVAVQFLCAMIPPIGPTSLSFVLIPIVIGGLVLGTKAGAILGLTFGIVTVIRGLAGMDALTTWLMFYDSQAWNMVVTILVCLLKGVAAGTAGAWMHRLLSKSRPRASIIVSAAIVPIVNTAIFAVGMLFLLEPLTALVGNAAYFLGFSILLCNFLPELVINLIAAPAIYRVAQTVGRKKIR